jgi:RNA polymerase sigma-70 factor (ECF subfamily)
MDALAVQRVREVYDVSYRRLVGQLTGVTGDPGEAEDVVMEAFVKAVKSAGEFGRLDNPEAWLRTVAVNAARTRWRRRRWLRESAPLTDLSETSYADLEPDRLDLLSALRQLPAAQREVIGLHHLADLPVAEVADTLGIPVGTVKARLSRGRAALALLLDDHEADDRAQPERSER